MTTSAAIVHHTRSDAFNIDQISPFIGAEVVGFKMQSAIADDDITAEIRRLLLKYKVLFFRDQDISSAEHVSFARKFGELEVNPFLPQHDDFPELVTLYKGPSRRGVENAYHADVTWRQTPSMGSVLRCLECPAVGGDTIWVNMALAYERLPADRKEEIAGLFAAHDAAHSFGGRSSREERDRIRREYPPQEHPVVVTHEETGEKLLYVNQAFTTHFCNFKDKFEIRTGSDHALQAGRLMQYLFAQAEIPEYQVRLRWKKNTVAFWDNRSTQHYAIEDYFPAVRRMERATIIGTQPN